MSDSTKIVYLRKKKNGIPVRNADGSYNLKAYRFFPNGGGLFAMSMDMAASDEMERLIAAVPHAGRSGLRKLAYYAVKGMKKDAKSGGPPGEHWAPRSEVTRRFPGKSGLRWGKRRERRANAKSTFGPLWKAIGYFRHPAPEMKVEFGFLSRSAYRRGVLLQRGVKYPVSKKMRHLFFARGFKRPGETIDIPARNLIGPSFAARRAGLVSLFEQETQRVFMKRTA